MTLGSCPLDVLHVLMTFLTMDSILGLCLVSKECLESVAMMECSIKDASSKLVSGHVRKVLHQCIPSPTWSPGYRDNVLCSGRLLIQAIKGVYVDKLFPSGVSNFILDGLDGFTKSCFFSDRQSRRELYVFEQLLEHSFRYMTREALNARVLKYFRLISTNSRVQSNSPLRELHAKKSKESFSLEEMASMETMLDRLLQLLGLPFVTSPVPDKIQIEIVNALIDKNRPLFSSVLGIHPREHECSGPLHECVNCLIQTGQTPDGFDLVDRILTKIGILGNLLTDCSFCPTYKEKKKKDSCKSCRLARGGLKCLTLSARTPWDIVKLLMVHYPWMRILDLFSFKLDNHQLKQLSSCFWRWYQFEDADGFPSICDYILCLWAELTFCRVIDARVKASARMASSWINKTQLKPFAGRKRRPPSVSPYKARKRVKK